MAKIDSYNYRRMYPVTSSSTRIAAAGIAALATLGVTACTPPNENPSDQKIDTASSQSADSLASSGATGQTTAATATNVAEASSVRSSSSAATSTAVAGQDDTPFLNNCDVTDLQRPTSLNLDCEDNKHRLDDIVWDQWTAYGATGTATEITVDPDRVIEGAQVSLGAPQEVDGKLVFSTITVDGVQYNPESQY